MDHQRTGRRRAATTAVRIALVASALGAALTLSHGTTPAPSPVEVRTASFSDPVPPTDVTTSAADRALGVSWTASSEALVSGYQVLVDGSVAVTTSGTGTSATVSGLVNGRSYTVTVRTQTTLAGTTNTGSTASTPVAGTPRDSAAPAAPTGVTATRGEHQVVLSWTAGPEYDIDGYRVLRDGVVVTGRLTATSFTDTGLTNDQTYSYTVQTHDTSGNWSASSTPAVSATPTDLTPPAVPTGLAAARGEQQVTLSWQANGEADLASYRVLRDGTEVATVTNGTSYVDTGLTDDRAYSYRLVAVDTHGNRSAATSAVSATPTDLTAPAAPTGVSAVRGDGRVSLTWSANAEPDLASYRLLRNGIEIATVTGGTSYTDTGLSNDTDYSYRIVAVDTHGNRSLGSTAVTATPTDLTAPSAPTGLAAARGDGQVVLSWTAGTESDLASYRVLRDGVEVATVTGTSYTDTGLTNDRAYAYRLVAVDTHGNRSSASSPAVTGTPTDLTAPGAPTGLVASRGDGQVALSWTAGTESDIASYRVLRNGTEVATVTGTSYTDTGRTNDTTYSYRLVAVDTHGNRSAVSSPAVTATPTDLTPPAAPAGFGAVRGDTRVDLSWTANGESDLASYRVLRDGAEIATVTGTSYADTAVVNDTTYGYALVAVDTHGNRSAAATASAIPTDLTAPATPTGFTAARGDGRVTLSWQASTESDVASYRVFRDGAEVVTVTGTSYTDTGLTNDQAYSYRLVAVDTHGNRSAATAAVGATPTDLTAPATPTGFSAVRGDGRVDLSWTAGTESDLAGYRVFRDGVLLATVSGTSYADTGLTNDQVYAYRLVAVDGHGNASPATATVTATPTDLTPPAAPTGVTATRGDGRVVLSWTAGTEPDLASYRVLRDGTEVATVTGTSYTDTGLTNDQAYAYRLVAVDGHGNRSTPSGAVTGTPTDLTAPAAPAGFTAVRGDGRVDLSWAASTEPDLASYRVLRNGTELATVSGTTYADTAVANDTSYSYAVVAVDTHGNRSAAATASATPTDLTPPGAPTNPAATAGERQVTVTWTAPAATDVVGYRVLRSGSQVATATGTSATLTGLAPGTAVTVTVVAVDGHGNVSTSSAAVSATPYDTTAPAAPTAVTGRPGNGSATISWTAPTDVDPLTYRVLRDGTPVTTASASPVTVTGLTNGATYSFTVVAVDPSGNASAASTSVAVVPVVGTVPAQGSGDTGGLAASSDGRYVVVGTRAKLEPSDTNTAYELYRLDRTAGSATRIAPLPGGATTADATNSAAPAISDDGRYVALATTVALLPADTNRLADVYRLDTVTGTWALVSVPVSGKVSATAAGTELQTGSSVNASSPAVVISGDGDLVLFYSSRSDLGPADTNGVVDVYAKRMSTGAVTRVSTSTTGTDLPRTATGPALALTPDGRFALFPAAGSGGPVVLYRKTLSGAGAGQAVVVSTIGSTEVGVFRDTGDVDLSDDGRYIAFVTAAKPTAPGSSGSTGLAYRKDTTTGALAALGDGQTGAWEHQVALDPTGRYGFFSTTAAVTGDTNGHTDVFRRDLQTRTVVLVTADADGRPVTGPAGAVSTAEYGRVLAVSGDLVVLTTSQGLLPADTNRVRDLYVKDLAGGTVVSPVG